MIMRRYLFIFLCLFMAFRGSAQETTTLLKGCVIDAADGYPLIGVSVVVSGTKNGEAWYWNQICEDGVYYQVDLLESRSAGEFTKLSDEQMVGYVWDYSAYPAAGSTEQPVEMTE